MPKREIATQTVLPKGRSHSTAVEARAKYEQPSPPRLSIAWCGRSTLLVAWVAAAIVMYSLSENSARNNARLNQGASERDVLEAPEQFADLDEEETSQSAPG